MRSKSSFVLMLLGMVFGLSGCLKDRFVDLPVYFRGTKVTDGQIQEISAVNFGMRKGDEFYRIRFQIFTDSADQAPEVLALRFKDGSDSTIWLDFTENISQGLQLKVKDSCATRENPNVTLCWSEQEISLELHDQYTAYNLKRDRGPLDAEIVRDENQPYTVKELVARARLRNYKSAEEAVSVFQAKEKMAETRGNLLPHFNMRDLISVVTDGPIGLIGAVGDLVPFIFPTHWNQWSKSQELYQAEILSFAALLANEMNTVEGLYYVIHRDREMLSFLDLHLRSLEEIEATVLRLEKRGVLRPRSAAQFGLAVKTFQQDRRQLSALVTKELAILSEAVGLSPVYQRFDIVQNPIPDLTDISAPRADEYVEMIKDRSPEIATLYFLEKAAAVETGQKKFGFLDPHSGDFFGAGYSHSIRIASAEIEKLKIRRLAMATGLERRAVEVSEEMSEALDVYRIASAGYEDIQQRIAQDINRPLERGSLSLADPEVLSRIIELYRESIQFEASRLSSAHAFKIAQSKWNRLLLQSFYSGLEVVSVSRSQSNR